MPYKRRYNYSRRRRYYNRRKIAPTKKLVTGQTQPTLLEKIASGVGSAASVAKAVLPMIQAINTEVKYFDTLYAAIGPIFSTPSINILTPISQGTNEQNRIGNSILAKNLTIRYRITPDFTASNSQYIRFVLFVDKHQDGSALPLITQLMQTNLSTESAFNKDFTDRFAILKDKRITLTASGNNIMAQGKVFKRLNFHIRYVGTSGAATDLGNNQLFTLWWTNSTANPPLIEQYSRLNFTDN